MWARCRKVSEEVVGAYLLLASNFLSETGGKSSAECEAGSGVVEGLRRKNGEQERITEET